MLMAGSKRPRGYCFLLAFFLGGSGTASSSSSGVSSVSTFSSVLTFLALDSLDALGFAFAFAGSGLPFTALQQGGTAVMVWFGG